MANICVCWELFFTTKYEKWGEKIIISVALGNAIIVKLGFDGFEI